MQNTQILILHFPGLSVIGDLKYAVTIYYFIISPRYGLCPYSLTFFSSFIVCRFITFIFKSLNIPMYIKLKGLIKKNSKYMCKFMNMGPDHQTCNLLQPIYYYYYYI